MTGEKNRIANFGYDYADLLYEDSKKDKVSARRYPFKTFVFPACKKCNETYGGTLEINTKRVIEKILGEKKVSHDEIDILLDWFDKVRIGLWLGYLYNNKDLEHFAPKFFIDQRIGLYDRALYI